MVMVLNDENVYGREPCSKLFSHRRCECFLNKLNSENCIEIGTHLFDMYYFVSFKKYIASYIIII